MTADNVLQFKPVLVPDEPPFNADELLNDAKSLNLYTVVGETLDGKFYISSSDSPAETLLLMERAKHHIVAGDD